MPESSSASVGRSRRDTKTGQRMGGGAGGACTSTTTLSVLGLKLWMLRTMYILPSVERRVGGHDRGREGAAGEKKARAPAAAVPVCKKANGALG